MVDDIRRLRDESRACVKVDFAQEFFLFAARLELVGLERAFVDNRNVVVENPLERERHIPTLTLHVFDRTEIFEYNRVFFPDFAHVGS